MATLKIKDGREFEIQKSKTCVSVEIDGMRYVAPDVKHLREGFLETEHGLHAPPEREPVKTRAEHWVSQFRNGAIPEKQEALKQCRQLASEGVPEAVEIVQKMDDQPKPSPQARVVGNTLHKKFEDVSPEEITQHVDNIVLRSKLIDELAQRLKV